MTTLFDLTVTRFDLFLRSEGREPKASEERCWQSFYPTLQRAAVWGKCDPPANSLPQGAQIFQHDFDASNRRITAESWLDVYCLETAVLQTGASPLIQIPKLDCAPEQKLDFAPDQNSHYLGSALCYWAEYDAPLSLDEARKLITPSANQRTVALDFGFLAFSLETAQTQKFVMFVERNQDAGMRDANIFLRYCLPRLLATRYKGQRVFGEYQTSAPEQQKHEAALVAQANQIAEQSKTLGDLEKDAYQISGALLPLAKIIGAGEEYKNTLSINARNAETIVRLPLFDRARAELQADWVEPLQLQADQIGTDLTYLQHTVKYIQEQLTLYDKQAIIISSQWQRRLTILFGLFVLLSVPQLFPEITNSQWSPYFAWRWRLLYLVISGVLMWGVIWWLGKNKQP